MMILLCYWRIYWFETCNHPAYAFPVVVVVLMLSLHLPSYLLNQVQSMWKL